MSRETERE